MSVGIAGIEIGLGALQFGLVISRVEFHEQCSGLHKLVVLDFRVDISDRTGNTRTDRIQMAFHLRVVSRFELLRSHP